MLDYASLYASAAQLPVADRLKLISDLESTLPQGDSEMTPDREARIYAEAQRDVDEHRDQIQRAIQRRGGISTAELLRRAEAAGKRAANQ